jgi:membrane protein
MTEAAPAGRPATESSAGPPVGRVPTEPLPGHAATETSPGIVAADQPPMDTPGVMTAVGHPETMRSRVRSVVQRCAVRLDRTSISDLWARLLEMEFIDRSIALAAKLFVSLFPVLIVVAAVSPVSIRAEMLDAMRARLGIDGAAMDLVRQAFATPDATKAATGFFGIALTIFFGISFTTAVQRVYLRAWRRPPGGGVRNKGRGVLWLGALLLFLVLLSAVRSLIGTQAGTAAAWTLSFVAGTALWWWTARLMVRGEVRWRALLPTAALTAAGSSLYAMQSDLWMPTTVANNYGQFGAFGVALSLVTFFTGIGFIIVVAAAVAPVLAERDDRIGSWLRGGRSSVLEPGAEPPLPGPARRVRLADAFARGNRGWGVAPTPSADTGNRTSHDIRSDDP